MATATARRITCPSCQASYRVPASYSRPTARCKRCGHAIPTGAARASPSRGKGQDRATAAVQGRSSRAQRALGMRTRPQVSGLQVATGVVTVVAIVAVVVALAL